MSGFESAVEAVVSGDLAALQTALRDDPALVRARSERPHHATLLHYVAGNGVEDERQKTPPNAVEVARTLLDAGAEVDALADTYGGGADQTTLNLLVSSIHPYRAGLQERLVETLLDRGAAIEGLPGNTHTPLMLAIAFHYPGAAETLVRRGARVDTLTAAAALGRLDQVKALAGAPDIERAFIFAAAFGRRDVVDFLARRVDLAAKDGEGMTALHWAAWYGHLDVVELLIERGAPLGALNNYGGDVLGATLWASQNSGRGIDHGPVLARLRRG